MNNPLVSIIIPCYNGAAYVATAIECALMQQYVNKEILLVDNNSEDSTYEIFKKYKDKHPSLITVLKQSTPGAPATRNKGLDCAKGEWVQFLDSDDEILPEKIAEQIRIAEQTNCDIVVGNYYRRNKSQTKKVYAALDPWSGLITSRLGNTVSNLWKTSVLKRIGGWDESQSSSQEYKLLFDLLKTNAKLKYDPKFLTVINTRDNSISRGSNVYKKHRLLENIIELRMQIKNYLVNNNMYDKNREKTLNKHLYKKVVFNKYKTPSIYEKYIHLVKAPIPFWTKAIIKTRTEMVNLASELNIQTSQACHSQK